MLVTLACTALLIVGTRKSAMVNSVIVVAKVLAILVLVVACLPHIDTNLWHPFVPPNSGKTATFGWSGVMRGAGIVFFAYIGFRRRFDARRGSQESAAHDALSLGLSLLICTALYVAVSLAVTGIADYHLLNVPDPLYQALSLAHANLNWLKVLVAVVAGLGLIPVILLSLLGQIRIFYAMGRDGLLPAALVTVQRALSYPAHRHPRHGRCLRAGSRLFPARSARRADFNRHADGLCDRLRGHHHPDAAHARHACGRFGRPGCRWSRCSA